MNKKIAIFSSLLALFIALSSFTACGNSEESSSENPPVEEAKTVEFTFDSNLNAATPEYPLSTGKTYYVAANGNDNYDGLSESTPFKTVKKINKLNLVAGDTVAFRCGDIFSGAGLELTASGADDNPINICSYGQGAKPKLLAQGYDAIKFTNLSNIVIRDLEIIVHGEERVSENTPAQKYGISGYYDTIDSYRNIYIYNNTIHGSATQATSGVRVHAYISKDDNYQNLITNLQINRNEVYDLGMAGIFTDSWFYDWASSGGTMNCDPMTFANVCVNNNTTYNIAQIPIYLECCHYSEINRNYVYDSAMGINGNAWLNIGQCGIMTLGCYDTDVMYNEVYNIDNANIFFDGMGIDIDWNCKRVNVQYNHTYNCTGSGIGTMANVDCFILNNRVENNDGAGKQIGQIDCIDFTNRKSNAPDDMHVVKNLLIKDNLIVNDNQNTVFLGARENGGDSTKWGGNVFENNHLVSTTESNDVWFNISETVGWYKFANNKYYKHDTSKFMVFESTDASRINASEGAVPFDGNGFESWKKRDLGATYEVRNNAKPSAVANVQASFANGKLTLTWDQSSGDLWHYNLYLTQNPEEFDYTHMLGETVSCSYAYDFQASGVYYVIIQPESNQGNNGTHTIVKITLQ